jgi:acetyltransferase-like isoleucine patch superfamily enzyme
MPIDRSHAFGDGAAYARRTAILPLLPWTDEARAASAWRRFDASAEIAEGCLLGPHAWCINSLKDRARIQLASRVVCRGLLRIDQFGDGRIVIGANSYIGDDCLLSSACEITIGDDVLIAHGVQIFDNDSHPVELEARKRDFAAILSGGKREPIAGAAVRVESHAWIGFNAIILKGVTIGEGSVVGAGSVVVRDVPPFTVVAGNPAVGIKNLTGGKSQ